MKRTWRVKLRVLKMSARRLWRDLRDPRTYIALEDVETLPLTVPLRSTYVKAGDIIEIQAFPGGSIKRYHVV